MRKLLCPHCNEVVDIDVEIAVSNCPNCGKTLDVATTINQTKAYVQNIHKTATQYYESAYSFEEAYRYFTEFLRFEPDHLDTILTRSLTLFKTSSLKKNLFTRIQEEFDNSNIVLEATTYIRIGHYFEELMKATFGYNRRIVEFLETASDVDKEIAYNTLIDLYKFYDFIEENINMFTEEEYNDSIFVTKDEFKLNKEKLLGYIRDTNVIKFDVNNPGSAEIFVNNKKIIHSEFDINNYEDVTDFAFFRLLTAGLKKSYMTFGLLVFFALFVIAGIVLLLVLPTISWIGWTLLAVGAAGDALTYFIFTKKRSKTLATLND